MAFSIDEMRAHLTFGGARNSQFSVQFSNPADGSADIKVPFMVKAATLPTCYIGTVQVPYFGRTMKVAGDRQYEPWQVTVINDEDFLVRNSLETWSNKINSFEGNIRTFGSASPAEYKADATVTQYSKTGVPVRTYKFIGVYPTQISAISLNWGHSDNIEEFGVVFMYDYFIVDGGITGDAGGY